MDKKKKKEIFSNEILGMAQKEHINRHGEAASQIIQANKGIRYDAAGNDIGHKGRSLTGISQYKLNPDPQLRSKNVKQQAGFSAELVEEARKNREYILEGKRDRVRTTDGLGYTNHQQYDLVNVDEQGKLVSESGLQMKFLGIDGKGRYSVVEKIVKDPSYDKYDLIGIPKDQYDGAVAYAKNKAQELQQMSNVLRNRGNVKKAEELEKMADKYQNSVKRLRKTNLTSKEAYNARLNPDKFTAKEVLNNSLEAGIQAMTAAVFISGTISVAQNMIEVIAGKKEIELAAKDVLKTTAGAGASAMFIGTAGTALKAAMHTSKAQFIRCLGNTSAPAMIAVSMVELYKGLADFAKGEISVNELFEELGEKSICSMTAGLGAGAGGLIGSGLAEGLGCSGLKTVGSIVGGVAGGMVTYTLCAALYKNITTVLKEEKVAHERRIYLEELCKAAVLKMNEYQKHLMDYRKNILPKKQGEFDNFFKNISRAIEVNDIDGIYKCFNHIGDAYGFRTQFQNYNEFDAFMKNSNAVLKL